MPPNVVGDRLGCSHTLWTCLAWLGASTGSSRAGSQHFRRARGPGAHRDTPAFQPASPGHSLLRLVPAQPSPWPSPLDTAEGLHSEPPGTALLGTTGPGSLHPRDRMGEVTKSLLPGCHWLLVPTLKGIPPHSPCPGTSPPARLPARLPLAPAAADPSPSPVPSTSSNRKRMNAMGLPGGAGTSRSSPVSWWHTPQSRDPELAARQRPELYRAPGAGGEAPPRRRLQGGGFVLPRLAQGVPPRRWGPRSIRSPGGDPHPCLAWRGTAGRVLVLWVDSASGGDTGGDSSRVSWGRGGSSISLASLG